MKFSIITPTHLKNAFLSELYVSLAQQQYSNWEWIIWLNGGASKANIEPEILNDSRVFVYESKEQNSKVGYNKNKAFHLGTGDVLVEADHDDILTPDCLQELYNAFQDPEVGFVYSDTVIFHHENKFVPYDPSCGWTHKKVLWRGGEHYSVDSFPATSRSLSFIWYAPDHVRAWRRNVYVSLGGHNIDFDVCDDHELLIRTYLNSKMHHIPKPLYIYRITGNNTWLERNQAIQNKTRELFQKYAFELACKDAKNNGLHIVELGGGINPRTGCEINIDLEEGSIKHDLNDGIPLPDNSVGVIWASHILEHLHDKHKIMCEIHRVLADGGWAFIQVPSTDGRGAFQDPTHVSYWNENCFWYYTRAEKARFIRNNDVQFQEFRLETFYWEPREHNVAVTDAWLVAVKSNNRKPHTQDLNWKVTEKPNLILTKKSKPVMNNLSTSMRLSGNQRKKLFVVDNFYQDPDAVRRYALAQDFNSDLRYYKGKRTPQRFSTPEIKENFEQIIGEKILSWETPSPEFDGSMNGVFQYCTPEDPLVYHWDLQKWAAMVFLTPDAPLETGTAFYRHKTTGIKVSEEPESSRAFAGGHYDSTKFELIDQIGNVYNRCMIFDSRSIHAACKYFGQTKEDSRLFHIFFFS